MRNKRPACLALLACVLVGVVLRRETARGVGPRARTAGLSGYIAGLAGRSRRVPRHKEDAGWLKERDNGEKPRGGQKLRARDIMIAVRTSRKFHRSRLALLLATWIPRARTQTIVFTDGEDKELEKTSGITIVQTHCPPVHSSQALTCKLASEYRTFLHSGRRWFCHVDDDNYVNPGALSDLLARYRSSEELYLGRASLDHPIEATERIGNKTRSVNFWFATGGAGFCLSRALAVRMLPWVGGAALAGASERIRLPDDCTLGYIVQRWLHVALTPCPLFHSHLENLALIPVSRLLTQVTLSYGVIDNRTNVVNLRGPFSISEDPSRFHSLHCLLFPDTSWCPRPVH
uniref:beta-1,3-N-acetylglucosaminyltransferase lunatic fringe-like n=1 Tax=Myxine glutinosa TaxID=7769 RepID=UPI00358EE6DF